MKVILRKDIPKIGAQGEIKNVSDGYARNFLIPRQMVWEANENNMKLWEKEKVRVAKQKEQVVQQAKELAEKIEKLSITIPMKVGESGKLFGSVSNANISRLLEENGFNIDKHSIILEEPLKDIGVFSVEVRVHPEVTAKLKVWIVEEK